MRNPSFTSFPPSALRQVDGVNQLAKPAEPSLIECKDQARQILDLRLGFFFWKRFTSFDRALHNDIAEVCVQPFQMLIRYRLFVF